MIILFEWFTHKTVNPNLSTPSVAMYVGRGVRLSGNILLNNDKMWSYNKYGDSASV